MGIFPYIYYMVRGFNITDDESKISLYAGLVTSAFTFAEFATGLFWGRLSDRIGRKPVLLTGLIGTAISVVAFGFAQNLLTAIIARAIGGLLNGYVKHLDEHRHEDRHSDCTEQEYGCAANDCCGACNCQGTPT